MTALPTPGALIGSKYRVIRLLGEGGMGAVYEARHEHLAMPVALKFLHPDLAQRPAIVARFLQEGRVAASIRSEHVTQVMDVDQTQDGAAYLVMELLQGEPLEKRLERGAPLPLTDAVDIGLQILSALEVAHAHGIVHRDLKPDNVWLTPSRTGSFVKLLDFGIAKLRSSTEFQQVSTRPGSIMGTPAYMAPEQAISADQVDHRADLYSFGVILYEMLSGARPVEAEDPQQVIVALAHGNVVPLSTRSPHVPPELGALVDRLIAPNPERRPGSAASVRDELLPFARPSAPSLRPSGVVPIGGGGKVDATAAFQAPPAGTGTSAMPQQPQLGPPAWQAPPSAVQPAWQAPPSAVQPAHPWQHQRPPPTDPQWEPPPVQPVQPPLLAPPPRRRSGLRWVLALLLLALAGGGVWLSQNPSVLDSTPLPPYPTAQPSAIVIPPPLDPDLPLRPSPLPTAPRAEPGRQSGARPPSPAPSPPSLPSSFPAIPLPSQIFPLPSTLPQILPQIPGITAPATPAPAPTPTVEPAPTPSPSPT